MLEPERSFGRDSTSKSEVMSEVLLDQGNENRLPLVIGKRSCPFPFFEHVDQVTLGHELRLNRGLVHSGVVVRTLVFK